MKGNRKASWRLGSKGTHSTVLATTVSRRCKVGHNNGIDQGKWPPLCWHTPYRVSLCGQMNEYGKVPVNDL